MNSLLAGIINVRLLHCLAEIVILLSLDCPSDIPICALSLSCSSFSLALALAFLFQDPSILPEGRPG